MGTVVAVGQQEFQGFRECRPEIRRYVLLSSVSACSATLASSNDLKRTLRRLIPYAIATGLLVGLQHSPVVETTNLLVYDLALHLRNRTDNNGNEILAWPITVVGINEADLERFGWPLDSLLCSALQRIDALGAKAIGLDLYRDQAKPCLQQEVQRNPRLISIRNEGDGIAAIPGTPARQQAFNDLVMDADRVVRRDLVHVAGQGEAVRSLPLRLLETAAEAPGLDQRLEELQGHHWLAETSGVSQPRFHRYKRCCRFTHPVVTPTSPLLICWRMRSQQTKSATGWCSSAL